MPEFDYAYRVIRRRGEPDIRSLDTYRRTGGYTALEKAVREQTPDQIVQQVLDAQIAWARWRWPSDWGEVAYCASPG
jgi:NADH-quinone oxidoreductase subunit F